MASGDVINTAARLQSAAPVNGILVGETTYRATKDVIDYREAEAVEAKGKSAPVPVWEALEARSRYGVDLGQARAPLFGRERELDALRDALERARSSVSSSSSRSQGFRGSASRGSSTSSSGRSRPSRLHDLAPGPLAALRRRRQLLGAGGDRQGRSGNPRVRLGGGCREQAERGRREVADDPSEADWMAARLGSLVGLQSSDEVASAPQGESFSAWRRFLESLADRHPLVLVFEDLHWADDGLLDFIDQLVDWARSAPILVLCTARPELLERRPGWGGGKANATTISLPPLEDEETARLLSALLERAVLPAETHSVLWRARRGTRCTPSSTRGCSWSAAMLRTCRCRRRYRESSPPASTAFGFGEGPPAGRLRRRQGLLARVGSGYRWDRARRGEEALLGLERKELVQRARRSSVEGEGEYAFRHLLVRDVAYGQIPRAARADKHRAAAEWVEGLGRPDDHAEMLASHYSRALEYARAAGSEDGESRAGRIALRDAGDRASSLQAWPAAARFYTEALELWPEDDSALPHLHFRCGRARFNADGTGLDMLEAAVDELEAAGEAKLRRRQPS